MLCLVVPPLLALGCAAAILPDEAIVHNGQGAALLAAGELDDAEASFRLALEYHPRFTEARVNLGTVALARGDLPAAERELRGALRLDEDQAQAWANLGVALEMQGRHDEAREAWLSALRIDPGLPNPRRSLARSLARDGDAVAARAHLARLLRLTPTDHETAALLAWCELRLGRPRQALARAERSLAIEATHAPALVVRGAARAVGGDLDGAVTDLERAADDPIVGHHARVRLAAVLALSGAHARAEALAAAVLRERPDDPGAHLVAGWAALEAGSNDRAAGHARRALAAAPELEAARALLARARP